MSTETVNTREEVEALPVMSVVIDAFGAVCTKIRHDADVPGRYLEWVRVTTALHRDGYRHYRSPYLPGTVIHRPDDAEAAR